MGHIFSFLEGVICRHEIEQMPEIIDVIHAIQSMWTDSVTSTLDRNGVKWVIETGFATIGSATTEVPT